MLFRVKYVLFKTEENAVRGQTKIIADTFEKQTDNHISININKKFDKFKDENKKGITNEPGQQANPICDREKSSKCQQQKR